MKRRKHHMKKRTQTPYYIPTRATLTSHKSIADLPNLSRDEARTWVAGMRERLVRKQERERAYLDRRAARGTHTPTDDAYEADQLLENELLAILDDILQGLAKEK
jgi:hypothetical protein